MLKKMPRVAVVEQVTRAGVPLPLLVSHKDSPKTLGKTLAFYLGYYFKYSDIKPDSTKACIAKYEYS